MCMSLPVFGVNPESEILELPAHAQPVRHRLLLRVHVEEVVVEGSRLVDVHPGTEIEQEAGIVAEKFGTKSPERIQTKYGSKMQIYQ